jgi:hypothetical protein
VWHILDVAPNSPADIAGLLPYGDYVIGCPDLIVRGESGLGELVEEVCIDFVFHLNFLPFDYWYTAYLAFHFHTHARKTPYK